MNTFRIVPVPADVAQRVRMTGSDGHGNSDVRPERAGEAGALPCRVCLKEAEIGDELLLFSYSPFERPVPYRNVGPIFAHANGCEPYAPAGGIPELMRRRLLALRGYDANDRMVECDLVEGKVIESMV